jgi:Cu+-exporting ATPase
VSFLPGILRFSQLSVRVVRISFVISSIYNVAGISVAASGRLSPVVCAILMPLSSVTVVAFACGATKWLSRRAGLGKIATPDFKEVTV